MTNRFVQIHSLTAYPAALLNRDDAGFAKRIPFGGATRTRISSQCLKRHWRTFQGENALSGLGIPGSVRSRHTFERFVAAPLRASGVPDDIAEAVTATIMAEVLGESAKAKKSKAKKAKENEADKEAERESGHLQTGQITVLGRPEVDYLLDLAKRACEGKGKANEAVASAKEILKGEKRNLRSLQNAAGLDAALFGRMVTGDILARGDAAVHVAHAFTVHAESAEADYFSAVDDLLQADEDATVGSGHIGTTELTSGLFYGYVVVDLPLLVSNLTGCDPADWAAQDRSLAAKVVDRLLHLVATVSPGAKLGSTAPYAYANLMLVETGKRQPRTLANGFLKPVTERPDLLANAFEAMGTHLRALDKVYDKAEERCFVAVGQASSVAEVAEDAGSLASLASWVARRVEDDDA